MKCLMTVLVAALAFAAVAQDSAGGPAAKPSGRGPGPSIEPVVRLAQNPKMAEKLGITEEQAAKLKALEDNRAALKDLQAKVKAGTNRQAELLKAEKIDEAAVMAAIDEVWAAKKEVAKLQTKRVIAIRSILSADQIHKALEAMKAMRGNRAPKANRPGGKKAKGATES